MRQCSRCSKIRKFLLLLVNGFPFVREFRLRKIRQKKIKMQRVVYKNEPKHLRRYIMQSGTIRRL